MAIRSSLCTGMTRDRQLIKVTHSVSLGTAELLAALQLSELVGYVTPGGTHRPLRALVS